MEFWIEAVSTFLSSMFFWYAVFDVETNLTDIDAFVNEHRFLSLCEHCIIRQYVSLILISSKCKNLIYLLNSL